MITRHLSKHHNSGLVLGVVLIILLAITLLGSSLVTSANLNQKIANNQQDENRAFQAAETAIAAGERWVSMNRIPFAPLKPGFFIAEEKQPGLEGLHKAQIDLDDAIDKGQIFTLGTRHGSAFSPPFVEGLEQVSRQPVFLIRMTHYVCDTDDPRAYFKIISRGWGRNPGVKVDLVSRITRRIDCNSSVTGSGSDAGRVL